MRCGLSFESYIMAGAVARQKDLFGQIRKCQHISIPLFKYCKNDHNIGLDGLLDPGSIPIDIERRMVAYM